VSVVPLFSESLLAFIGRTGGALTPAIAARFGWDMRDAKRELDKLRDRGLIECEREIIDWGAANMWRLTDVGRAELTRGRP
jgi:DNA-binding MarR family transcriptional regulator